jgi:hypothetical protein
MTTGEVIALIKALGGGSGGGVLVVTDTDGTLDKTWQEIYDAFVTGSVRIMAGENDANGVLSVRLTKGEYRISMMNAGSIEPFVYVASSASGYPAHA